MSNFYPFVHYIVTREVHERLSRRLRRDRDSWHLCC